MEVKKVQQLFGAAFVLALIAMPPESRGESANEAPTLLDEMVITASKAPKTPGNVTQKVDIIDSERIDNIVSGNRNIAELLMYEPGVSVSVLSRNDANWGASGGLSQKYNTYMLDGLPIDAFVEPQSLSVRAFERIERQRGPAAVLYPNYMSMDFAGNQSPLTGTTNLILKERIDKQLTEIDTYYGTYNTFGGSLYHQQAIDNFHIFFGGDYEQSDYTNYGTDPSWLNMIDDPEYKKNKFYLRPTLFLNDNEEHKLSLFVSRTGHEGDTGRPNRDFDHEYWTINADYALPLGEHILTTLKIGYRGYDRTWEDDNYPASLALVSENGVEQQIFPVDFSLSYDHLDGALMTFGIDYQTVSYETFSETSAKAIGNDADTDQVGIYLQEELPLGDLLFRLGGRYSYTKHDIHLLGGNPPGNNEESWNEFLWSLGARYHLSNMISIYSNAGSSFVAPSLKSVGGTLTLEEMGLAGRNGQLPNPDLKPESGIGYDLGTDISPFDNMSFGIRAFYNIVDDQIVTVVVSEDPSQSQDINAGETTSYGVELIFDHKPVDWLKWFANYTYTSTEIENSNDPDQDGTEVPFVPEHMGNIGADLSLPYDLSLSVYLHVSSAIYDSTSKSGRQEFDGYEVLNASLRKKLLNSADIKVEAYLDLYNLTNNEYEMPWQFQDPGFSFLGGIKARF